MSEASLHRARTELEDAVAAADEGVRDPLRETAAAFAELASADREPDHAVLDAHLNTLRQVRDRADGDAAERVDRAIERVETYREGLEQA